MFGLGPKQKVFGRSFPKTANVLAVLILLTFCSDKIFILLFLFVFSYFLSIVYHLFGSRNFVLSIGAKINLLVVQQSSAIRAEQGQQQNASAFTCREAEAEAERGR